KGMPTMLPNASVAIAKYNPLMRRVSRPMTAPQRACRLRLSGKQFAERSDAGIDAAPFRRRQGNLAAEPGRVEAAELRALHFRRCNILHHQIDHAGENCGVAVAQPVVFSF